jgi:DNA helicase-2/ATP-dependent DNA helicase PcrA
MSFDVILKNSYGIELNNQQAEAVNKIQGSTLLLSVPGGGKTTVIVCRIANMIMNHSISPDQILTLTFSKASAFDMKYRFLKLFGNETTASATFSTIHSFCYNVIDFYVKQKSTPFPKIIENPAEPISKYSLIRDIYYNIFKEPITEDILEEISRTIGYVKNMLFSKDQIENFETNIPNWSQIYYSYESHKKQHRYIDYDDMLVGTYKLFQQNKDILNYFRSKYPYVNVDEAQDTSFVQHEIIKLLTSTNNNLFMVGDEDQSIYGFRAAFPKALLEFKKTYPDATILLMENNYRSTSSIVNVANEFIKQNKERYLKNMTTSNNQETTIVFNSFLTKQEQISYLMEKIQEQPNSTSKAILFRNNISSINLIDYLDRHNLDFYIKESNIKFFSHWVLGDILSFIKLSLDLNDISSFSNIFNKLNLYLSKDVLNYVKNNYTSYENIFETLLQYSLFTYKQKSAIFTFYKNLKKIPKKSPVEAIKFIETDLSYNKYIQYMVDDRGYSKDSLSQIIQNMKLIASNTANFSDFFNRIEQLNKLLQTSSKNKSSSLTLSSIHSAKGLEFDSVYIIDLIDGQFPSTKSINDAYEKSFLLMEEEVRLFYVAVTRAKNNLELITYDSVFDSKLSISRFYSYLSKLYIKNLTQHSSALSPHSQVKHSKFGVGTITNIDVENDTIKIQFSKFKIKTFSLETCIENNLLQTL